MIEKAVHINAITVKYVNLFLLFILFFISDDTVNFGTNLNQAFILIKYVIYTILIFMLSIMLDLRNSEGRYHIRDLIFVLIVCLSFFLTMATNLDIRNGYLLQGITLFLAMLIAKYLAFDALIKLFSKFLFYLSIISLIIFPISFFLRPVLEIFPTTVNFGGEEFINLIVCMIFKNANVVRNTSIFREPGVFMLYLQIGIIIELYYKEKINLKYLAVFTIALITTLSTSGFFIFFILLMGYLLKSKNFKVKIWMSSCMCLIFLLVFLAPGIYEGIFSKLGEDSEGYASTLARISSITVPFMIFLNNPFFGSGLSKFVDLYLIYSQQLFGIEISPESSSTNTIINTFAIFGLVWGASMVYGLYRFAKYMTSSFWMTLCVFIALLMMFSSQELRFSLFFNLVIMYGLFYFPKKQIVS